MPMQITHHGALDGTTGYSAHADQNDLQRFVTGMAVWPSQIRIVYGVGSAKQSLSDLLFRAFEHAGHEKPELVIPHVHDEPLSLAR